MKHPVVEALWEDHSFTFGSEEPKPHIVRSVGFLIKDTRRYIVLAQSFNKTTKEPQETLTILKATLKGMRGRK